MIKTLVTGGSGFIGSNLVRLLVKEGHGVTVLDNLSSGYRQNLAPFPDIRFFDGDVRGANDVEQAIEGVEVVFHMAASVGNTRAIDHPIDDAETNVIGTLNILEAAYKQGVRKVIYSSSAGIFGELKTVPIREDHPTDPDSPYGISKLAGEKYCLAYSKLYKLEAVCLRYFNVYGVNQRYDLYGNVIPKFAHCMLRNEPIIIYGDGEQTRDFVSVRDVVQANYKAALAVGVSGAFNIASGTSVTVNRLVELMRDTSGIEPFIQYAPPRAGDVRHSLADISAAASGFGYHPSVDLEGGLAEYFAWAKTELLSGASDAAPSHL